jgi:hypothetical protein
MIRLRINIHNLAHAKTVLCHLALACCVQHTLRRNGCPAVTSHGLQVSLDHFEEFLDR